VGILTQIQAAKGSAVLLKQEGDPGNASHWHRRAGRTNHVEDEPRAELAAIRAELTADGHR